MLFVRRIRHNTVTLSFRISRTMHYLYVRNVKFIELGYKNSVHTFQKTFRLRYKDELAVGLGK